MIDTLARQRTHLRLPLLLAALAALIGALFAAAPVQAAPGDLNFSHGHCSRPDTGSTFYITSGAANNTSRVTAEDENGVGVDIECGSDILGLPVRITANGTTTPQLTAFKPALPMKPDRPVVRPGQNVVITLAQWDFIVQLQSSGVSVPRFTRNFSENPIVASTMSDTDLASSSATTGARLDWIRTSGELGNPVRIGSGTETTTDRYYEFYRTVEVPLGTTPGVYTVSASMTYDTKVGSGHTSTDDLHTVIGSTTFTVSDDPGPELASATLVLGNAAEDDLLTSVDEERAETGSAPAAGSIWLILESESALGEPSALHGLNQVSVFAPGADIAVHRSTVRTDQSIHAHLQAVPAGPGPAIGSGQNSLNVTNGGGITLGPLMYIKVGKADGQPGTIAVDVLVGGPDGVVETETLTLTFTGPAAALELGGDLSVGQPAAGGETMAETSLMATDAVGNAVNAPSTVAYSITDADGKAVNGISATNSTVGASTTTTRDDDMNAAAVLVTIGDSVMPGSYTLTASLPGVDGSATSVVLKVAGPPANVELTADKTSGATLGDVITATAAVTDADGVPVADGSEVTFLTASPTLFLIGIDANATTPGFQSRTVDGEAAGKFTVVGDGTALIIARIGGQSAIVVINSSTTPAAPPPPETAAECLSGASGLVSWICDDSASAAEIFAELSEGGATALHLYNGTDWVFYAIVNGRQVPGSVDFTVLKQDILFIGR